ncbi:alkaline phosphatase [Proteobacteria bacterium 005FR1]|nr:alkaline phosphatase [Proteobacteria bacterium 005FR1]
MHALKAATALALFSFSLNLSAQTESPEAWFESGQQELQRAIAQQANTGRAKNVILFVGDGMGISTVTAARIYEGQRRGESGEENSLAFERLPYAALSKTYNTNQQTPDSAGTMTAMMSGIKTKAGFIGVNQRAARGDCKSSLDNHAPTFLQQAEAAGMATGIVSTARLTHATPAATYAHVPERDWESDANLPESALSAGCKDIASQLLDLSVGDGVEVALGGGRRQFTPASQKDPQTGFPGARRDGRDLTAEWQDKYPQSQYVWNREQLNAVDAGKVSHLLGLFNASHLSYHQDRQNQAVEPSLPEMTRKAIEILRKDDGGFFLMVEAGRIDHAHHAGNAQRALEDTRELSQAVETALEMTDPKETLIIVTADHSHTLTIAGYPTRGNPILGKVVSNDDRGEPEKQPELASDELPYTTLGYRNGRGFAQDMGGDSRYRAPINAGRHDLREVNTEDPDYHQEVLVPSEQETHAGEEVAIYAGGPWAHLFRRTHEQHYIYHVMRHAAQLDKRQMTER